jgi:hypothetical protein
MPRAQERSTAIRAERVPTFSNPCGLLAITPISGTGPRTYSVSMRTQVDLQQPAIDCQQAKIHWRGQYPGSTNSNRAPQLANNWKGGGGGGGGSFGRMGPHGAWGAWGQTRTRTQQDPGPQGPSPPGPQPRGPAAHSAGPQEEGVVLSPISSRVPAFVFLLPSASPAGTR